MKEMKLNFSMNVTAADAQARTISGRIVTWGENGNTSIGATRFAADSLKFNKTTKLLLEHDRTRPIGKLLSYEITSDGIDATFKVANTMAGEDALVEASDGLRDGFSVGVAVDKWGNDKGVTVIEAARIQEVSLVTDPAIDSARVSDVAASENETDEKPDEASETKGDDLVSETAKEAAAPEAVEAAQEIATVSASAPVAYTKPRSPIVDGGSYLEHSIKAAMGNDDSRQFVKFADDTSNNTGLTLPSHMNEFITTTITGRAAIDAISTSALPASGLSFTIPKLTQAPTITTVAEDGDTTAGDEMTSSYITVDVKKAAKSETISWELLDRSSPSYYAELIREMNAAYAKVTDAAVLSALISGGTVGTGTTADADGLQSFIATESAAGYAASGGFTRNLIANTSWWALMMGAQDSTKRPLYNAAGAVVNGSGAAVPTSLVGNVLGTNLYVDPHFGTGTLDDSMLLVNPEAATFYEAPKTQLSVQVLGNGQVSVGVYGYYAIAIKKAGGIRRFNKA